MYLNKKQSLTRLIIIVSIFILLNVWFTMFFFRIDITADKRYTLSKATKNILKELTQPVTVTAYFSKELPADIISLKNDFKDLLVEYEKYSGRKIYYTFENPDKNSKTEEAVLRKGIQPILVDIRKKDKFQQQKVYMGAVVQVGDLSETIPALQPGAPMEYALTFAIKKCSQKDKPMIAIIQGHREAEMAKLEYVVKALSYLYTVESFDFNDTSPIPSKYKAIAIFNPQDSFSDAEFRLLDSYLASGGNIFIAHNAVLGELSQLYGYATPCNLPDWLEELGIKIHRNFIYDVQCLQVQRQQKQGNYTFYIPMDFYYLPVITSFSKHAVVEGLESLALPFVSEITYLRSDSSKCKMTILASSSMQSGTQSAPTFFDLEKKWTENDFQRMNIPVSLAIEGKISGQNDSRMVVISNGIFAQNDQQGRIQGTEDNINFVANAMDWLADRSGLAELRTKSVNNRPLMQISEKKKNIIKYGNSILPIVTVILFGIIRKQYLQSRRKRQITFYIAENQSENYEN